METISDAWGKLDRLTKSRALSILGENAPTLLQIQEKESLEAIDRVVALTPFDDALTKRLLPHQGRFERHEINGQVAIIGWLPNHSGVGVLVFGRELGVFGDPVLSLRMGYTIRGVRSWLKHIELLQVSETPK